MGEENMRPDLTVVENYSSLPSEAVFLPQAGYEDLGIATTVHRLTERIGGARVNITLEIPDEILDDTPTMIAHGYCGTEGAYAPFRNALARNGKVAGTYDTPRVQANFGSLNAKHFNQPTRLLSQSAWAAMRGTMKFASDQKLELKNEFDLIGHSMGAPTMTRTALKHPEHVRSVLMNEGAGFEPNNTLSLLGRVPAFAIKELPSADPRIIAGSAYYVMRNLYRTASEGMAVSNCDIRESVQKLGQLGIKTAIMFGQGDSLIHAARAARFSGEGVADKFVIYSRENADHLYLQKHPLEAAMAQLQILDTLHGNKAVVSTPAEAA